MNRIRTLLLVIDGVALAGLLVFSVLAAIHTRHNSRYVIGQIACIVIVGVCVLLLRQTNDRSA